jgi:hypothetical protein
VGRPRNEGPKLDVEGMYVELILFLLTNGDEVGECYRTLIPHSVSGDVSGDCSTDRSFGFGSMDS